MKTTKNYILFGLALSLVILNCKDSGEINPRDFTESANTTETFNEADELAKIENLRQRFQLAIKEKRYQDLGSMVSKNFRQVGPASTSWLEYQKLREKPMGKFSYDSIVMHPQETVLANDSLAYDFGTSNVYYTNAEGNTVELEDTFLAILKKEEGEWKLHLELASGTVK